MEKIFLIAGEASGDALGGRLIEEIKYRYPNADVRGVGGDKMRDAGMDVLFSSERLSVMGLFEIIGNIWRLRQIQKELIEDIESFAPDVVVSVDFPDFNFLLGRSLKKRGIFKGKLIHYVAPSVWAWRPGRARFVSDFLDGLMCLFPFEPDYFKPYGLPARFVGHSLVEEASVEGDPKEFRDLYGIPEGAPTMAILFGSRQKELGVHGAILRDVAEMVAEECPDMHFIVPTLPHLEYDVLKVMQGFKAPVYVISNLDRKWDAFAVCDAAVAVSGTVGLELTYAGVPHVIAYKTSFLTWNILRRLVKVRHAHLVNLLLGGDFIPEFLQKDCDALHIGNAVLDLIEKPQVKVRQNEASLKIRNLIGAYDQRMPSQKAVDYIEKVIAGEIVKTAPEPGSGSVNAVIAKAKASYAAYQERVAAAQAEAQGVNGADQKGKAVKVQKEVLKAAEKKVASQKTVPASKTVSEPKADVAPAPKSENSSQPLGFWGKLKQGYADYQAKVEAARKAAESSDKDNKQP